MLAAFVICVDKAPKWSDASPRLADAIGRAEIHFVDPGRALAEMVRVLEPGGLVLFAEPDNYATLVGESSLSRTMTLEEEIAENRYALIQARGRVARGLGNLSVGGRFGWNVRTDLRLAQRGTASLDQTGCRWH